MTDLLVRRFIPDHEDIHDEQVRTQYGILASMVGIICNLVLFSAKLAAGLMVHSISVMADAFNNLSDAASSIIGFVGVWMAGKPADEDHPFGHGRIEYIAAFIVAFLVIEVGLTLFKNAAGKIFHPVAMAFKPVSILILVLSICVKLWMGLFNKRLGKRIGSKVMLATAADSLGDVAATSATIISVLVFRLAGVNIDGIVGLVVSVVVMIAGVNIAKDTLAPLIGEPIDPKLYRQICDHVKSYDGIVGVHDLIIHNYGPSRSMASIHAEVPDDVDVKDSHAVIDQIEREAFERFRIPLVIHMDPIETKDERFFAYRDMLKEVLDEVDHRLGFHDLRMVAGTGRVDLIFDLVVPRDYQQDRYGQVNEQIVRRVRERDGRCCCVITMENSYCAEA